MYRIEFVTGVADDLADLRAYDRRLLLDEIDKQLTHEPARRTGRKKILVGLTPPWEYVEPIWQLQVGEYRVFYDIDEVKQVVTVRAVRHKPPHVTTEEIL
jgi:mRNA-degrading endonuclease RelE of RelBE toxin-antitoxin system